MNGDEKAYFFYMVILFLLIGAGFLFGNREKLSTTLMQASIWVLVFCGVLIAYGFKDTLQQQFVPSLAVQSGGEFEIVRANDRHFHLTLKVNGVPIKFIVDTGASDIVLTREDAERTGVNMDSLAFLGRASTANGTVKTATTVLNEVVLGDRVDHDVRASVNGGEMFGSLLGMSYLNQFSEISIRGDRLILKP